MSAPNVNQLSGLLASDDPKQRAAAAETLAQLPDCREACLPLVRACGTDAVTREWAVSALEEMGSPPAELVPALTGLLEDPSDDVAYWAATLLGRLEGQARPACDALAGLIDSSRELFVRERAVWAAQRIGGTTPRLADALNSARDSSHARLARLAGEALEAT